MRCLVSFLSRANTHDDDSRISWLQLLQIKHRENTIQNMSNWFDSPPVLGLTR